MDDLEALFEQTNKIQISAHELSERFVTLRSFPDASLWDEDARALIKLFEQARNSFSVLQKMEKKKSETARHNREALPFFKRLFASKIIENTHNKNVEEIVATARKINGNIENLYDFIDKTPNSLAEQKAMLSELKELKKDLQLEKRVAAENVRLINTDARTKMSNISGVRGRGFVGDMTRLQRMSIRNGKEAALRPHEDQKAAINRRLLDIDKKINWIIKFTNGELVYEQPNIEKVLRCAYCGRRVSEGTVCRGCGSDFTTYELV